MNAFSQATFLASSGSAADRPPPGPPEIAFAGRSNVGKSSAINALPVIVASSAPSNTASASARPSTRPEAMEPGTTSPA